ncbi:MAG: transketolase C-terminal domain-containing protein, partial [Gammaproteobacteria bacterium]
MRFVKPLDTELIRTLAQEYKLFVTIEENAIMGGAGSAVNEYLAEQNLHTPILNLGLPDCFIEHGVQADMLSECGLDAAGITKAVQKKISHQPSKL